MTKKNCLILIAAATLIAVVLWFKIAVPELEKLPQNFSYRADVFSLDNFYDEENQQFLGEQISKTRFSYEVVSTKGDALEIKNIFDVRKISGEKIFAVERVYGIDALTGKHLKGHGDKDRNGYLFAPKNLKKQDYVYWHINYDAPATLKFQEEVVVEGLKLYRYEADYHADQTDNLGFLPGVPEKRGINLDINLQTWIEPVTGGMVKYEDRTIAYYYDIKTGRRLHPWNKFSNTYDDSSISLQISKAKAKKLSLILFKTAIPTALGLLAVLIILICLRQPTGPAAEGGVGDGGASFNSHPMRKFFILFLVFFLVVGGFVISRFFKGATLKQKMIKIGVSDWVPNTLFENNIKGFKDALAEAGYVEGRDIQYIIKTPNGNKERQREIIKSFVNEGVDIIYTLTTTGALIAKGVAKEIPIVFSVVTYPVEAGVIASLEKSENNLVGTRNYIPPSKQYAVFERIYPDTKTLGFVHRKGEPNSDIQYNEFRNMLAERNISVLDIAAIDLKDLRNKLSSNIDKVDSLYAACDTLIQEGGEALVIEFSKQYKTPSFTCNLDGAEKGSLAGNVANLYNIGKISGEKAANILQGIKPEWLRTESPRGNYIIVNLEIAEQLGLTVPQDLIEEADKVITKQLFNTK